MGSTAPLPSIFAQTVGSSMPPTAIWHEVCGPGVVLGVDGSRMHSIIVREVGTDSLVFDSDHTYQPGERLSLEFTLEEKKLRVEATVRRTARTLSMEMCFATTVDFEDPGEVYISVVTGINPVDEKTWWD
jgi:hypothetical protein